MSMLTTYFAYAIIRVKKCSVLKVLNVEGKWMYKIYVPVYSKDYNHTEKESLVRELKRIKPDIVFLVFHRILCNEKVLTEQIEMFENNRTFLQENGFRVGVWLAPTIGYGSEHWGDYSAPGEFMPIHSIDGVLAKGGYCPLDHGFSEEFLKLITKIAKTGVKDILFEDDFTLTGGKAILLGCCCDKHMEKYNAMVGEQLSIEELQQKMIAGGKNKYRDAWCKLMGKTLSDFAEKIGQAVHSIDPDIRIGLSANASSYILEGIGIPALARKIAGNTKPMIRMTGAPYWTNAVTLGPNIDAIRVQEHWCGEDIELLTEGDTYPRPRSWVPASYLECYDMILRAEGKSDGILKYVIDYTYNADYETGYVDAHCRNEKHYEEIEKRFQGKEPVGLNVFENQNLFMDEELGADIPDIGQYKRHAPLPLISQWFLSDNSIPTVYGKKDCASIVFGANAHHLDETMMQNGVILDAQAAKILVDKGVDIGIQSYKRAQIPMLEHFIPENEYGSVMVGNHGVFYDFEIKNSATVLSEFIIKDDVGGFANISPYDRTGTCIPACFCYQNECGQKFMIFSFVAKTVWVKSEWTPGLFRNYYRQKQLGDGIQWLQNRPLPAMCYKSPQAYILCKKNTNSMTVGVWNIFADTMYSPEIILDGSYRNAEFYNCDGILKENKIQLHTDIIPYGFALITVYQ